MFTKPTESSSLGCDEFIAIEGEREEARFEPSPTNIDSGLGLEMLMEKVHSHSDDVRRCVIVPNLELAPARNRHYYHVTLSERLQ